MDRNGQAILAANEINPNNLPWLQYVLRLISIEILAIYMVLYVLNIEISYMSSSAIFHFATSTDL